MSQLAAQLNVLSGGFKSDPRRLGPRPSFLFNAAQAANVDNEAIFHLGLNGFAELRNMDERFAPFEATLFNQGRSAGHATFDRNLQSKEANIKLDESLASFLRLLSPYFMIAPSHKVIEFLIRRYQINDFNTDAIMECILPYHETNFFARMLQLTKLPANGRWEFMTTAQKSGAPVARQTLVQRCLVDSSMLSFIAELAQKQAELARGVSVHKTAITLFTLITLEVLTKLDAANAGSILRVLAPHLLAALGSARCAEYQTAGCMLLTQLAAQHTLDAGLVHSMLQALLGSLDGDSIAPAPLAKVLLCVVAVCQYQPLDALSKKVLIALANCKNFVAALNEMRATCDVLSFVNLVLSSLVSSRLRDDKLFSLLLSLVKQSDLSDSIGGLTSSLLNDFISHGSLNLAIDEIKAKSAKKAAASGSSSSSSVSVDVATLSQLSDQHQQQIIDLLRIIERRYPRQLDIALDSFLKSKKSSSSSEVKEDSNDDSRERLLGLIHSVFDQTAHQVLDESGTTLFFSLEHASEHVRAAALDKLRVLLSGGKFEASAASSILEQRLSEQQPKLLAQVLSLPGLTSFVDTNVLLTRCISVLDQFIPYLRTSHPSLSIDSELRVDLSEKEARQVVLATLHVLTSMLNSSSEIDHGMSEKKRKSQQQSAKYILNKLLPLTFELLPCIGDARKFLVSLWKAFGSAAASHSIFQVIQRLCKSLTESDEAKSSKDKSLKDKKDKNVSSSSSLEKDKEPTPLFTLDACALNVRLVASLAAVSAETLAAVTESCLTSGRGLPLLTLVISHALSSNKSASTSLASSLMKLLSAQLRQTPASPLSAQQIQSPSLQSCCSLLPSDRSTMLSLSLLILVNSLSFASSTPSVLIRVFTLLSSSSSSNLQALSPHLHSFLHNVLPEHEHLNFLAARWLSEPSISISDSESTSLALHVTHARLLNQSSSSATLCSPLVFPGLLVPLLHPSKSVRHATLLCISDLSNLAATSSSLSSFAALLQAIVKHRDECLTDATHIARVLTAALSASDNHALLASLTQETVSLFDAIKSSQFIGVSIVPESKPLVDEMDADIKADNNQKDEDESDEDGVEDAQIKAIVAQRKPFNAGMYSVSVLLQLLRSTQSLQIPQLTSELSFLARLLKCDTAASSASDDSSSKKSSKKSSSSSSSTSFPDFSTASSTELTNWHADAVALLFQRLNLNLVVNHSSPKSLIQSFLSMFRSTASVVFTDFSQSQLPLSSMSSSLHSQMFASFDTSSSTDDFINSDASFSNTAPVSIGCLLASHLNADFFASLSSDSSLQVEILQAVLNAMGRTSISNSTSAADYRLQSIVQPLICQWPLDAQTVLAIWPKVADVEEVMKTASSTASDGLDRALKPLTAVLELLQYKSSMTNAHLLVGPLFECLDVLVPTLHEDSQSSDLVAVTGYSAVEFSKQLILSAATQICQHLVSSMSPEKSEKVLRDSVRMVTLVRCVQASTQTITRNHGLKLLGALAPLAPTLVLNAVLPIFTSSVSGSAAALRQQLDDAYSFSVMVQTLEVVLPAVLRASSSSSTSSSSSSKPSKSSSPSSSSSSASEFSIPALFSLFVDAAARMPSSRRLPLFVALVNTMGAENSLHVALALLLARGVQSNRLFHTMIPTSGGSIAADYRRRKQQQQEAAKAFEAVSSHSDETSDEVAAVEASLVVDSELRASKFYFGDFAHALCFEFGASEQMLAMMRLIRLMDTGAQKSTLFTNADSTTAAFDQDDYLNFNNFAAQAPKVLSSSVFNAMHVHSFNQGVADFLAAHLPNNKLLTRLLGVSDDESAQLQQMYLKMFELMFLHVKHVHEQESSLHRRLASSASAVAVNASKKAAYASSSSSSSTSLIGSLDASSTRKQVQTVLRAVQSFVERLNAALVHVNGLLSAEGFLRVVIDLLSHADLQVRRKAVQLLTEKILSEREQIQRRDVNHFVELLPRLVSLIEENQSDADSSNSDDETERAVTVQTCLLALDNMIGAFSTKLPSPDAFVEVIPVVISCLSHRSNAVLSSSLLCLATSVAELQTHIIPHFPSFFPLTLSLLERSLVALKRKKEESTRALASTPSESSSVSKKSKSVSSSSSKRNSSDDESDDDSGDAQSDDESDSSSSFDDNGLALVVESALTCTETVVTNLPQFISSHISTLLKLLLHPVLVQETSLGTSTSTTVSSSSIAAQASVVSTLSALAEKVPARLLLPAVFQSLRQCINNGDQSTMRLFGFLAQICSSLNKEDVRQHHKSIFKFYLVAFDTRRLFTSKFVSIDAIEISIVQSFIALVVKLNESQLKPLFLKVLEWVGLAVMGSASTPSASSPATNDDDDSSPAGPQVGAAGHNICRSIILFRLVDSLLDRLKSFFVPYLVYIMDHCVTYLGFTAEDKDQRLIELESATVEIGANSNDAADVKKKRKRADKRAGDVASSHRALLASLVVSALNRTFANDSVDFLDKDKFDRLLRPLVGQLELGLVDRAPSDFVAFVETQMMPTLVQLASRLNSEALWKPLHHEILLLSRHSAPHVRYASVRCVTELFARLGMPYLALLPETVPFVAELMEDDNIAVEHATQLLIRQIESLSGESMENYLK